MNQLTISSDRLARLRKICLAFPGSFEKEAWGDPTWRVADRIFAMQKGNVAGARPSLWMKAPPGAQEMIVGADPARYFVPPYVGHQGWIGVYLDGSVDWKGLEGLIEQSFRMTARPKARRVKAGRKPAVRPARRGRAPSRPRAAKRPRRARGA